MTGGRSARTSRAARALRIAATAAGWLAAAARADGLPSTATAASAPPDAPDAPDAPARPGETGGSAETGGSGGSAQRAGRRLHGSVGAGGALLLTGDRGDHARLELAVDCKLGGRYGALAAWRAPDEDHRGLVTLGLIFEAGAARPRLVLDLHADVGADLDAGAPLAGGGLRATLGLAGPLGIVVDSGGYVVLDGLANTRLQLQGSALLAVRW